MSDYSAGTNQSTQPSLKRKSNCLECKLMQLLRRILYQLRRQEKTQSMRK